MTLGRVHVNIAHPADAIQPLQQAVELFAELEAAGRIDTTGRAATLGDLVNAFMYLGRFDQALQAAEEAAELLQKLDDLGSVARAAGIVGTDGRSA